MNTLISNCLSFGWAFLLAIPAAAAIVHYEQTRRVKLQLAPLIMLALGLLSPWLKMEFCRLFSIPIEMPYVGPVETLNIGRFMANQLGDNLGGIFSPIIYFIIRGRIREKRILREAERILNRPDAHEAEMAALNSLRKSRLNKR